MPRLLGSQSRDPGLLITRPRTGLRLGGVAPIHLLAMQRVGNRTLLRWREAGRLQAKVRLSHPGDPLEVEADRVADEVLRMPEPQGDRPVGQGPVLQRMCRECEEEQAQRQAGPEEEEEEEEEASALLQTKENPGGDSSAVEGPVAHSSGGEPLSTAVRAFFEPRFGYDFGRVRIHTDAAAARSAQAVNARAYAVGPHVVFGAGEYAPETTAGLELLAHELTHVVQQRHIGAVRRRGLVGPTSTADPTASQIASSTWLAERRVPAAILQRRETGGEQSGEAVRPSPGAAQTPRGRPPDVVANGYHSFYLRAMVPNSHGTEVRVQFYQAPSGTGDATFAVWYEETRTMQRVSFSSGAAIQPRILDERAGIATFDLNGDGVAEIVLTARPDADSLGVDFSASLSGTPFFTMAAIPPRPASNYVPGRGRYAGTLPDGRSYYFTGTFDQRGPRFVDERGQLVDPALEAQGEALMSAVAQGYLIGYAMLVLFLAGYALLGTAAAPAAGVAGTGAPAAGTAGAGAALGTAEAGTAAAGAAPVAALARQGLIAALRQAGVRFTEEAIVGITRTIAGRIVWLETGSATAGLTHIMQRHGSQFAAWGLRSAQQVGQLIMNTVRTLAPVATPGGGAFDFVVRVGGVDRLLRIVIGSNGFIVTAHPL